MALKVPIRFRGDTSKTGLEAERVFDVFEWFMLHDRTNSSLKTVITRALEGLGLNAVEWIMMSRIANASEEYTITQLAEDFDMNTPQCTVLIKVLIKRGYIKQKVALKDRRVKPLSCTRRGLKVVYDGDEAIQHAMRYWLFDLSDTEISQYIELMKKISRFEIPANFA